MATLVTTSTASFARPADTTQYSAGDLVADNTTAGSVSPMHFTLPTSNFKLQRIGLVLSATTTTSASFRMHLFSSSPTVANGDNGAFSTSESTYLGNFELDASGRTFTDKGEAMATTSNNQPIYIYVDPTTLSINGLIETRASYTPASAETFTVTLYGESY